MKEISITGGYTAFVDDQDFHEASKHTWHIQKEKHTMYAYTNIQIPGKRRANGKQAFRRVSLHRLLVGANRGEIWDHRNRNGLDCQRSNLRKCTQSENNANKITWGVSRFKGVYPSRSRYRKWLAHVQYKGKRYRIGSFFTEEEAARAYDAKAREVFGEFARLNF
jgi:hypothetical protein